MIRLLPNPSSVVCALLLLACCPLAAHSQTAPRPEDALDGKARTSFVNAEEWERRHSYGAAVSDYRKAFQQSGGHCAVCLPRAFSLTLKTGAYKDAEAIARDMLAAAQSAADTAVAHYRLGVALQKQGLVAKKDADKCYTQSCDELKTALATFPQFPSAHYAMGVSLAKMHQDAAAREEFQAFLQQEKKDQPLRERATRYLDNMELVRARMAPPFSLTTVDGQRISLDGLAGKVVLIDFWATWCGPCLRALPHMQSLAKKFQGQPLVILSVSLDTDEQKWRDFVAKNNMNWLQYRDGRFNGPIASQFGVSAIPATFTIDADGVLEDQRVGDADIDGKLKKLVERAREVAARNAERPAPAPQPESLN